MCIFTNVQTLRVYSRCIVSLVHHSVWVCQPSFEHLQNCWNQLPGENTKICFKNVLKQWHIVVMTVFYNFPPAITTVMQTLPGLMHHAANSHFYFPPGIFVEQAPRVSYKVTVTLSVHYNSFITPLYLVLYTWLEKLCSLHQ